MTVVKGDSLFSGFGFGKLRFRLAHKEEATHESLGEDIEKQRFQKALKEANDYTKKLDADPKLSKTSKEIVDAHLMMLNDPDFNSLVDGGISVGESAEEAIQKASKTLSDMLIATGDDYIAQRAADVKEIAGLLLDNLSGKKTSLSFLEPTILAVEELTVSELLGLDKNFVKGLVLINTGKASHVAIVVRSVGIPTVLMEEAPDSTLEGKEAILNASVGELILDYDKNTYTKYKGLSDRYYEEQATLLTFLDKPTVTADGVKTTLYANIATPEEAAIAAKNGAEGIGLFRSEFIYMNSSNYPSEDEQFNEYVKAVKAMKGKPVVIRTFDIGSDKKASYFGLPEEENPALGYRSIRICEDRHELFLTQLRALYRASAFGDLSIMIPMIISPKEVDFAHEMCQQAMDDLKKRGEKFNAKMKMGIMIETPAAAITTDILAKKVDFFSIGTNDLSQYTLAIDRTNEHLTKFFDPHAVGILRLMAITAQNAHKAGIPVSICGELGHDEALLGFFMKEGFDHLSMSSSYILKTRQIISKIDTRKIDLKNYLD